MKPGVAARSVPWLALFASSVALLLSTAPAELQAACASSRAAITGGEPWRLWTGHFVHFGDAHLRGDLLAFLLWAAWLERGARGLLLRVLVVGAPLLSLIVLIGGPTLAEYRGLSGLDCSLVAALIWTLGLQSERRRGPGALCLAAFLARCGYELVTGRAILAPDLGEGFGCCPSRTWRGLLLSLAPLELRARRAAGSSGVSGPLLR